MDQNKEIISHTLKELSKIDRKTNQDNESKKRVIISISKDEMKAYINLIPSIEPNDNFTKQEIIRALNDRGVVFGIKESTIDEILEKNIYFGEMLVAEGSFPEKEPKSKIEEHKIFPEISMQEYYKLSEKSKKKGTSLPKEFPRVAKGEILLSIAECIKPEPGKTVTGKILMVQTPQEEKCQLKAGTNTNLKNDGTVLAANSDGWAVKVEDRIFVIPHSEESWHFELQAEEGGIRAYVKATPPSADYNAIPTNTDETKIFDFLAKNNINTGIIEGAAQKVLQDCNSFILVAEGIYPINGQDAQIHEVYREITSDKEEKLHSKDKSKLDLKHVKEYTDVQIGDIIATKSPSIKEVNGLSVYGTAIPAKTGKDIPFKAGKGAQLSRDRLSITATQSGIVLKRSGNTYEISQVLEIKSNVDYSVGNIDFKGSVHIKGDILPGFIVVADDDITIKGNVERAIVSAGRNLTIKGGIYGSEKTLVKSKGNMEIRSAENAKIECDGNLIVDQYLMHSEVIVSGDIKVIHPSKGVIVGGKLVSGSNVEATDVGSIHGTTTIIEIGIPPVLRTLLDQLKNEIKGHDIQRERLEITIKKINSRELQLNSAVTKDIWDVYFKLVDKIRQNKEKIDTIEEKVKHLKSGYIKVNGTIYLEVIIRGRWDSLKITNEKKHVEFREINDRIDWRNM